MTYHHKRSSNIFSQDKIRRRVTILQKRNKKQNLFHGGNLFQLPENHVCLHSFISSQTTWTHYRPKNDISRCNGHKFPKSWQVSNFENHISFMWSKLSKVKCIPYSLSKFFPEEQLKLLYHASAVACLVRRC